MLRIAELESELEIKANAVDEAIAGSSSSAGGGKAADKAAGQQGQHGGWLPKCAKLVKAYIRGNWKACDNLCWQYQGNDIVAKIVG